MRIETATDRDLPAIAALHAGNWRRDYSGLLPDEALQGRLGPYMARRWGAEALTGAEVFVSRQGRELAGFVALKPDHPDGCLVDNLHVAPSARGRGLGRALMRRAAERAGDRPLWLLVFDGNHATRAIYRGWGGQEGPVFEDSILDTPIPARPVRWHSGRELGLRLSAAEVPR